MDRDSPAVVLPLLLATGLLALLWALFGFLLPNDTVDFGSTVFAPTAGWGRFLGAYLLFGGGMALALAWAASGLWARRDDGARTALLDTWKGAAGRGASDRRWMVYGGLLAFLLPALVRTWLLNGLPITDDEGAYRLMARILGSGRLYADSPPFEVFFDRLFVINDGRYYSQYFLGWPALMAPFAKLGLHGFANAVYSALAVPPLFFVLRRLAGSAWARLGLVLYLLSPMMVVAAATELSHTSCLCALAWLTWLALRSTDADAGPGPTAGVALVFAIAFWIRPLSALGAGLPLLLPTLLAAWRHPARWRRLAAFALPAALMGGLFLLTNQVQNGSPLATAYGRYLEYTIVDDARPSHQVEALERRGADARPPQELEFVSVERSLAVMAAGLLRLNVALFGWPFSFLFLAFAGWRRPFLPWLWASVIGFLLSHLPVGNVGIDAFAPMHFIELGWPVLLLTVLGLERASLGLGQLFGDGAKERTWLTAGPVALALGSVLVALLVYAPVRGRALARMSEEIARPHELVAEQVEPPAVVFTLTPFVSYCRHPPTKGWLHQRPLNGPDFDDPILWARHLSLEADQLFLEHSYPDRRGWLLGWNEQCRLALVPLEALDPRTVPDAPFDFESTLEQLRRAPH